MNEFWALILAILVIVFRKWIEMAAEAAFRFFSRLWSRRLAPSLSPRMLRAGERLAPARGAAARAIAAPLADREEHERAGGSAAESPVVPFWWSACLLTWALAARCRWIVAVARAPVAVVSFGYVAAWMALWYNGHWVEMGTAGDWAQAAWIFCMVFMALLAGVLAVASGALIKYSRVATSSNPSVRRMLVSATGLLGAVVAISSLQAANDAPCAWQLWALLGTLLAGFARKPLGVLATISTALAGAASGAGSLLLLGAGSPGAAWATTAALAVPLALSVRVSIGRQVGAVAHGEAELSTR